MTPTRDGVSALTGEGAELEVPENVQADLRKRADQEGVPVSASASVRFSHDLVTRETDSRVNVPKRDVASRAAAIAAAAKADPWEEGGALSGALNPRYAKIRDVLQEQQQQSKVARRRNRAGARELQARGVVERGKKVCVDRPKCAILYKRRLELPPFESRFLWGRRAAA